jgi:hypothetical protein
MEGGANKRSFAFRGKLEISGNKSRASIVSSIGIP